MDPIRNQKGQIHIFLIVMFVVGLIAYANFSGSGFNISKWAESYKISPSKTKKSSPPSTIIAPPAQKSAPTPTPAPAGPDTAPPRRSNPQPKDKSSLPAETRKIILGLNTDEKARCKYSTVPGVNYDLMQNFFDQNNATSHSVLITTLDEGGKYKYYIKCEDEKGNENTDDFTISFEVKLPDDKTPPALTNPSHFGNVLDAGTREAVISISTNELASCRYASNAGTSYNSMSGRLNAYDQTKKFHTTKITNLKDGQSYDFFVRCQDLKGNANTGDVLINFKVANPQ